MPVNVIIIVLQIGPTYQTCIYFAEKLMVLRCYDHNLNTDRKRRLWIWSGLFSVAFYENAAVSILRTAITLTRPTLHLCHKQSRLYFPLAFQTRPRWSLGFVHDIYIIKLRMWRDGSRLAVVCLGRWKFVGPRRSSLHSVRFGQLLVMLCTSTHCQCNESVHRKEQLLFTPFMTV